MRQRLDAPPLLCTFHSGLVWREDPGVATWRGADVEVELNVVL